MTASLSTLTLLASDGSYTGQSGLVTNENNWGGHQPRVVTFSSVSRILYMAQGATVNGAITSVWNVWKLTSGTWALESQGTPLSTADDCVLLRDPSNDVAYVIAWPVTGGTGYGTTGSYGVPTIYSSVDGFVTGTALAGNGANWQHILWANSAYGRHYGNAGIAQDGTVYLKASREVPVAGKEETTSSTNTQFMAFKFNPTTRAITYVGSFQERYIGLRHSYDWLHPYSGALVPQGLYSCSESDLLYTTAGFPGVGSGYIWNGHRYAFSSAVNPEQYNYLDNTIVDSTVAARNPYLPLNYRMEDSLFDIHGRMFVLSAVANDGTGVKLTGFWLDYYDENMNFSASFSLTANGMIPQAGNVRIIEDISGNKFIFYVNLGSTAPACRLYRLIETIAGGLPSFSLNPNYTDLSAALGTYAPQSYCAYIAAKRGGSVINGNTVDILFNMRNTAYTSGNYDSSSTASYAGGGQKIVHSILTLS